MQTSRKKLFFFPLLFIIISIALFVRAYERKDTASSGRRPQRHALILSQADSTSASLQEDQPFAPSPVTLTEATLKETKKATVRHMTRTVLSPVDILLPVEGMAASPANASLSLSKLKPGPAKTEQLVAEPVVAATPKTLPWEDAQNALPKLQKESEQNTVVSRSKNIHEEETFPLRVSSQNDFKKRKGEPSGPMGTVLALIPGDREITLTWDAAHGGNGFSVYYGTSALVGPENGIKKFCPTTPCTVTGLKNGAIYYFAVEENAPSEEDRTIIAVVSAVPTDSAPDQTRRPQADPKDRRPHCDPACPGIQAFNEAVAVSPANPDCVSPCVTSPPSMNTTLDLRVPSSITPSFVRPEAHPLPTSISPLKKKGVLLETVGKRSTRNIATGASGNAIAVWQHVEGPVQAIWASLFRVGRGWEPGTLISTDTSGKAFFPQVAMDSSGRAMAVWYQSAGTRYDIWANRFTPDVGWGTATRIEAENEDALFPRIAIDPYGHAIAVWYQSDGVRYNIWANRFTLESGWETPARIETDNAGGAFSPSIAMDSEGNAVAAWYQSDGQHYNIWANRFIRGSGWKVAARIATGSKKLSEAPQVLVDPLGNALVAWRRWDDNGANQTWINSFVTGLGWGTARSLEEDTTLTALPFQKN